MSDDHITEADIIDDDGWKQPDYDYKEYRENVVKVCLEKYNTPAEPSNPIETIFQMEAKIADLEATVSGLRELEYQCLVPGCELNKDGEEG